MKYLFLIFCWLSAFPAWSQITEKYYDYNWAECKPAEAHFYAQVKFTDSGYQRIDLYIHTKRVQMVGLYKDRETKIPHGYFQYYHANETLESTGRYVAGKKEGLWLKYHPNGMISDSTVYIQGKETGVSLAWHNNGMMRDSITYDTSGKAVLVSWFDNGNIASAGRIDTGGKYYGKWQFFHTNGQLSALELYRNGIITEKQYFDEEGQPVTDTTNRDTDALFSTGEKAWVKYLERNLKFPEDMIIINARAAVVVVDFSVSEDGTIGDVLVSVPFYPEFDKIAKRVVENAPNWSPAISHNRRVKTWHRQSIIFANGKDE